MSYIGKSPSIGSYSMLDNLTASATASYSLTLDSVAFVPETANHLLVSLNGIIQKGGSSYTVSGSTLTFSSALTSSDSIDFILALGNVLDIGTPSDSTVTNAKTNFVSTSSAAGLDIKGDGTTAGTLRLMCEQGSHGIKLRSPAHSASASYTLTFPTTDGNASEFLQTDGSGVLTWAAAGGITVADEWYVTSSFTLASTGTNTAVTANWTRNNNGHIGTNMTESSGVFTFPSTGIYLIRYQHSMYRNGDNRQSEIQIQTSTDSGSNFSTLGSADAFIQQTSSNNTHATWNIELFHDVTDASTHRARFMVQHVSSSVTNYAGKGRIQAQFIRLGDT